MNCVLCGVVRESAEDFRAHLKICHGYPMETKEAAPVLTLATQGQEIVPVQTTSVVPVEVVTSLTTIAESLKSISVFLGGQTLPAVLESYSLMQCIGQLLNGLTSSEGRKGLDARTIDQDAVDGTHRILKAFEHLKDATHQRRSGEHSGEVADAEEAFRKWVEEKKQGA